MRNDDKLKMIKEALLAIMREPYRWLLIVGTGTSVEMDTKLGMPALKEYLLENISEDTDGWKSVAGKLKNGIDLEKALTGINPAESLLNEIARKTAKFIAKEDGALRNKVLTGKETWVGGRLLQQLMRGLSRTWPRLPVVTPNYDMLIEYACSNANIPYITGYYGGIMKRQDWSKARERLFRLNPISMAGKRRDTIAYIPCIELMKVHGSINLFRCNSDGTFIENDTWTADCPEDYTPMIAPPGVIKCQGVLDYYDRLFGEAIRAIDKATAFLVVGYGFRDNHIHQKMLDHVRDIKSPVIVLTRDPSQELDKLLTLGKNVWVITGIQSQVGGKTDPSGTCFANGNKELCGAFDGITIWKSDEFVKQIMGG